MTFEVAASAYDRFMGRFSALLADRFLDRVGVAKPQQVLDVGCGPGALTAALVRRLGAAAVAAVDPSEPFVAAVRERLPGTEVYQAAVEHLPFPEARFDAAVAQLVVHFMAEPVAGLREMARVTRPGGTVGATVWDYGGDRSPLAVFWTAVREFDPAATTESQLPAPHAGRSDQSRREPTRCDRGLRHL
jgi:ubiquinone/menaquinone biosynthesis C-methylase UbiE